MNEETKTESDDEQFEHFSIDVEGGKAVARYKVEGAEVEGSDAFDEDVSDWTDDDLLDHAQAICGLPESQRGIVQINRE